MNIPLLWLPWFLSKEGNSLAEVMLLVCKDSGFPIIIKRNLKNIKSKSIELTNIFYLKQAVKLVFSWGKNKETIRNEQSNPDIVPFNLKPNRLDTVVLIITTILNEIKSWTKRKTSNYKYPLLFFQKFFFDEWLLNNNSCKCFLKLQKKRFQYFSSPLVHTTINTEKRFTWRFKFSHLILLLCFCNQYFPI